MRIEPTEIHTVDDSRLPVTLIKTEVFEPASSNLNVDPYSDIEEVDMIATITTGEGATVRYLGGGRYQVLDTGDTLTEVIY